MALLSQRVKNERVKQCPPPPPALVSTNTTKELKLRTNVEETVKLSGAQV